MGQLLRLVVPVVVIGAGSWQVAVFAAHPDWLGIDAQIYYRGSLAWLSGADPWNAGVGALHYAGTPVMVLLVAPFSYLPELSFRILAVGGSLIAAVYALRRLALPAWWLAFPPLVQGIANGNPVVMMFALLLAKTPLTDGIASILKIHALAPIAGEGRWRGLVVTAVLGLLSILLAPGLWATFLGSLTSLGGRYGDETAGGMAAPLPLWLLGFVAIVVLALIDHRAAGWLVVPALFPATGYYTAVMMLPVIRPWMALLLVPWVPGLPTVVSILCAVLALHSRLIQEGSPGKSPTS